MVLLGYLATTAFCLLFLLQGCCQQHFCRVVGVALGKQKITNQMNTTLILTMLSAYLLSIAFMFLIPEGWMPKGKTPDKIVTQNDFYKKVFIMAGALVMAVALLIGYLIG
jgi:hypothetical protein